VVRLANQRIELARSRLYVESRSVSGSQLIRGALARQNGGE